MSPIQKRITITQCVDTGTDCTAHPLIQHESEEEARVYAQRLSSRKRCDINLFQNGVIIDIYKEGQSGSKSPQILDVKAESSSTESSSTLSKE